jgi:hypothetical protein
MVGVMLYVNWRFTLIAHSVAPPLFAVVYSYTRRIKESLARSGKKEGELSPRYKHCARTAKSHSSAARACASRSWVRRELGLIVRDGWG